MTQKLIKTALLLIVFFVVFASAITSCKDNNESEGDNDDLYMCTTYSVIHNYYTPKKANLFAYKGVIVGDWFSNEKIVYSSVYRDVYGGYLDRSATDDYAQEYATHYFFLNENAFEKYCAASEFSNKRIMIDKKDIISPFKEYAAYYGDTLHMMDHDGTLFSGSGAFQACVLPLIAIDVVCDKEFDADHPAGSKLNDILFYDQSLDMYNYLQNKEYQGEDMHSGRGSCMDFGLRRLSLLSEQPVYLMESDFCIRFDHSPSTPGTYDFTVKFTFGADPLTGDTVDIAPAKVSLNFLSGKQH
jgi:hypothetical protein